MKTLCVIPVFNEDTKLISLINQIKINEYKNYGLKYIFINNGSTDNSLNIIKKNNIKFLNLKKNMGVGYALILGYLFAKKYNFRGQYEPAISGSIKKFGWFATKITGP